MNVHPIFVHFPLAFLTFYAFFEMARIDKILHTTWYKPVKIALLFIGTLTSFITLQTGEMAEELLSTRSTLVEAHSAWATASVWIFAVLAIAYLIDLVQTQEWFARIRFITPIARMILKIAPLLAFLGLITITVAGSLGGAIVYGKNADPIVAFIYKIVIGQ